MRVTPAVIGVVVGVACGSFEDAGNSSSAAINDAGAGTETTTDGAPAAKRGCSDPLPPNTKCWDFDEGDAPGVEAQHAKASLDESTSVSPGRSLLLETNQLAPDNRAWARLVHPIANAPKAVTLDSWMRVANLPSADYGEIVLEGATRRYAVVLTFAEGNVEAVEWTFNGLQGEKKFPRALGSTNGSWMHIVVRLELPTAAATARHLVVTVDDHVAYDDALEDLDFDLIKPTKAIVRAGISDVDSYNSRPGDARRANIDDVIISWTP